MSAVKIANRNLHIAGGPEVVIVRAGEVIPDEVAKFVTNPAAFTTGKTSAEAPAAAAAPAVAAATPARAPATQATPAAPVGEPLLTGYADAGFKALQVEAKRRELSGKGKADELIARLEADDRDKANEAAQAALDAGETTGTATDTEQE